jgi:NADH-quinone oxidoreductase subunit M
LAFFFAFAVKTPMVPVHIWLPKAHVDAPTVGSVILAGLLLKVGLIGFIRVLLPVFPEATHFFAPYVAALATVGVLYASLITLRQIDMKRIIAYSSVAHMNMAVVSLCSLNPIGLYSSIYLMLSHGLIASGLFFLVGFLYNRFHVRTVAYFGGLAVIMPVMTIMFFFFSLANMAFPFTSGFIGEFLLLLGIASTNFFLGFLNALSMLLTTVYTLLLFGRVFLGELKPQFQALVQQLLYITPQLAVMLNKTLHKAPVFYLQRFSIYDLYYYEFIIVGVLWFGIVLWGIYPQMLLALLVKSPNLQFIITAF